MEFQEKEKYPLLAHCDESGVLFLVFPEAIFYVEVARYGKVLTFTEYDGKIDIHRVVCYKNMLFLCLGYEGLQVYKIKFNENLTISILEDFIPGAETRIMDIIIE